MMRIPNTPPLSLFSFLQGISGLQTVRIAGEAYTCVYMYVCVYVCVCAKRIRFACNTHRL